MEVCADSRRAIYVAWETKPATSDLSKELFSKMIAIFEQDIVCVGRVAKTHLRDHFIVNFLLCFDQNGQLGVVHGVDWD